MKIKEELVGYCKNVKFKLIFIYVYKNKSGNKI